MKRNFLITLFTLFTITLFGEDVKVKAESQSYKHDKNTIFAIEEDGKFHVFKSNDELPYLGYMECNSSPQPVELTRELEEENGKHISDSHYLMYAKDGEYSLYYKDYMGDPKFLTTAQIQGMVSEIKEGEIVTKVVKVGDLATDLTYADDYETPDPEPESEEESDDEEDDSGISWWLWILIGWFAFKIFLD